MEEDRNLERVSVVIPTYNRPAELQRALHSVVAQGYPDLEIIVIDDNVNNPDARENTAGVVRSFTAPVRLEQNTVSLGGAGSRNRGIDIATGAFIAFLDDDDEWLPDKLSSQVALLQSLPDDFACVDTGFYEVNQEKGTKRFVQPRLRGEIFSRLLVKHRGRAPKLSTLLCKASVLREIGGFDPQLPARQDLDLYLRIARHHQFEFLVQPLAIKHVHSGEQITDSTAKKIQGFDMLYRKYFDDLRQRPILHMMYRVQHAYWLWRDGQHKRAIRKVFFG